MDKKFSLAIIALVGIGVFALPSTMALFSGQHSFYNIDATGNQVPCTKCHGDVKAELNSGYSATTGTKGPHADFKCEYCHRAESGFASGDDAYAKISYGAVAPGTGSLYLVTTVENYERGNFPKSIKYQAGMTVDNWAGNVFEIDGRPFVNQTDYLNVNNQYAGSLSSGTAGTTYNYSYASETATEVSGAPKDTNPATASTAFNPRNVTWNGSTESIVGAGSREITPGTKYHAASLVSCLECHGGDNNKGVPGYQVNSPEPYNHAGWLIDASDPNSKCQNCHYGTPHTLTAVTDEIQAGGFGLTGGVNDTGEVEAHKSFVTTNDGVDRFGYGASNGACIACHTHVAVDINFKKGYKLSFDAVEDRAGNYNVGNFGVEGQVNISVFGNASGQTFATGDKSYTWTPDKTMYVNGSKASPITGLNNAVSDSSGALTGTGP